MHMFAFCLLVFHFLLVNPNKCCAFGGNMMPQHSDSADAPYPTGIYALERLSGEIVMTNCHNLESGIRSGRFKPIQFGGFSVSWREKPCL